jgi:hypothetical protein
MKAGPHWAHLVAFAPTLPHEVTLCNDGSVPAQRMAGIDAPGHQQCLPRTVPAQRLGVELVDRAHCLGGTRATLGHVGSGNAGWTFA